MKNTCNASVESKGFCHYKCTNGIKGHLAKEARWGKLPPADFRVDTLGLPFFTHCTFASVSDDGGLIDLLSQNMNYFRAKPVNIPKITILLAHGYHERQNHSCPANALPSDYDQNSVQTCT